MAEVQKPQPGQRHFAQSHPCQWLFTSTGRAVGAPWMPQPVGVGSSAHRGASPVPPGSLGRLQRVSVSSFPPKIWAQDNTAATTCQPPRCHALSLPLGAAAAPCPRRLLQTHGRSHVTCAPSRVRMPALHSPPCFSNANVAFDVHVFILQQERDPALDRRSTAPTAALQQELPSCSLTPSQRFVIFEEITNLKVFGFGAAIAA